MRNEFRSLAQLKQQIKVALSGAGLSPRYQAFLSGLRSCAAKEGYRDELRTRLPAFDLLLHCEPGRSSEPDVLMAVLDGDRCDRQVVDEVRVMWRSAIGDQFRTGFWRAKHVNGLIVIVVEEGSSKWTGNMLCEEVSLQQGRLDEALVKLVTGEVVWWPRSRWEERVHDRFRELLACALKRVPNGAPRPGG